jgi:hypothetical protein
MLLNNITSTAFIMCLIGYLTIIQNYYTNCQAALFLILFIIMTVFVIKLCAEFLPTVYYSTQHNKYITLPGLISTLYSLILRTFNKIIFFLMPVGP